MVRAAKVLMATCRKEGRRLDGTVRHEQLMKNFKCENKFLKVILGSGGWPVQLLEKYCHVAALFSWKLKLSKVKIMDFSCNFHSFYQSALDTAATKIQAAYRGHSVRQGLNWKLPSGQTLGAALRDAPHVAHPGSDAMSETGGTYHTPRDDTASVLDTESLSMAASATGPGSRFELSAASNSDSRHRVC